MKPFADYFSENEIIRILCNARVKEAGLRDTRQYVDRLIGHQRDPQPRDLIYQILPPRSKWAQFRSRERSPVADPHLSSLVRATSYLLQSEPDAGWAARLRQFMLAVRHRVSGPAPFVFTSPSVRWELKKGHQYRAICRFSLEDNLICSLLAKYLRELFDPVFEPSSYAFRSRTLQGEMPTHHSAFEVIYRLKNLARAEDLFVAECDIRGFYDSVDHGVTLKSLHRVDQRLQTIMPGRQLHFRAMDMVRAYLDCYSFPRNVLGEPQDRLRRKDPLGYFPWPERALRRYHHDPKDCRIGVPQGGAISCVIANLVLDLADKRIEALRDQLGLDLHYLRYCDDMVLLARRKSDCRRGFQAYLGALEELKLPYHKPKTVWFYDRNFWGRKSKAPYRWTGKKWFGCVPWVQFVGYQVRYDGLVRIKQDSVNKHLLRLLEITDKVKFGLLRRSRPFPKPYDPPSIVAKKEQAVLSLLSKLTCMGVGRVNPFRRTDGPLPMCWANGYRKLHRKPIVPTFLKRFDRERARQIIRLKRAGIVYGPGRRSRQSGLGGSREPMGFPYSYTAQFENAGGVQLIQNPYQASSGPARLVAWMFTRWKDRYILLKKVGRTMLRWLRMATRS